jgi:FtsP/CotA-like multicopper oxidase with cupredoxin domain
MKFTIGAFLLLNLCLGNWVEAATVFFPLVLTWQNTSVAGNIRPVIHSNFQFPGPELQVNQGDNVQFAVTNLCPFNVTVHFHGKSFGTN